MTEVQPGPGWWKATDDEWYPPRWEYRWVQGYLNPKKGHEPIEAAVSELGLQGWEAVSLTSREPSSAVVGATFTVVLMKRPVTR